MSEPSCSDNTDSDLRQRILAVLDALRPAIQSDGGDIELVSVGTDGVVTIRFLDACQGCPSSNMTLKLGIEENLKLNVPEVTAVITAP